MFPATIFLKRNKSNNEIHAEEESNVHIVTKLPEIFDIDFEMATLIGGVWHPRRIVITTDLIAFAHVGDTIMIDEIPLSEIEHVGIMTSFGDQDFKEENLSNSFVIATIPEGHNSGRPYYFQAASGEVCANVVAYVSKAKIKARNRVEAKSSFSKSQLRVRAVFLSTPFQVCSASLIILNFLVCIINAQFGRKMTNDEGLTELGRADEKLNKAFTIIFTFELFFNLYANWLNRFIINGWNLLDVFIVTMSLVDMGGANIPDWFVRLMRALRVIRLFGRVKELKRMITAVSASVVTMSHAFVILVVVICIFSILGVSLFGEDADGDYGRFNRAFITKFKVSTGDSWPVSVKMLEEDGSIDWKAALYYCSFVIIVCWVLLAVCVAVLLDNFVAATLRMDQEEKRANIEERKRLNVFKSPLEPLIAKIARAYTDDTDLSARLRAVFEVLDSNRTGTLSQDEFCASLKKLNFDPKIYVTEADFSSLTHDGELCDASGQLGLEAFISIMHEQIRAYALTLLATNNTFMTEAQASLIKCIDGKESFARMGTIKILLNEQHRQAEVLDRIESLCRSLAPLNPTPAACSHSPYRELAAAPLLQEEPETAQKLLLGPVSSSGPQLAMESSNLGPPGGGNALRRAGAIVALFFDPAGSGGHDVIRGGIATAARGRRRQIETGVETLSTSARGPDPSRQKIWVPRDEFIDTAAVVNTSTIALPPGQDADTPQQSLYAAPAAEVALTPIDVTEVGSSRRRLHASQSLALPSPPPPPSAALPMPGHATVGGGYRAHILPTTPARQNELVPAAQSPRRKSMVPAALGTAPTTPLQRRASMAGPPTATTMTSAGMLGGLSDRFDVAVAGRRRARASPAASAAASAAVALAAAAAAAAARTRMVARCRASAPSSLLLTTGSSPLLHASGGTSISSGPPAQRSAAAAAAVSAESMMLSSSTNLSRRLSISIPTDGLFDGGDGGGDVAGGGEQHAAQTSSCMVPPSIVTSGHRNSSRWVHHRATSRGGGGGGRPASRYPAVAADEGAWMQQLAAATSHGALTGGSIRPRSRPAAETGLSGGSDVVVVRFADPWQAWP